MNEATLHAGRTIVVAGGAGNVGRVLVAALLRDGATVVVPSRSPTRLQELRGTVTGATPERLITVASDIGHEQDAARLVDEIASRHGPIHAAFASLGRFAPAPPVLDLAANQLEQVIGDYLLAHVAAAGALIPRLVDGGSYVLINGPLAFRPLSPESVLVSIATAAQEMYARSLMQQVTRVRVNEVVLYTAFGWGDGRALSAVGQDDVARYLSWLASERAAGIAGRTIHLDSPKATEPALPQEASPNSVASSS
jgi:NAD(P)-dependent dehydrogenase (short-subunit alcohol dehydrogenase family)